MVFIREFEFFDEEGMLCVLPFGMEGATCGTDLEDAVEMAADWLRIYALDALAKGKQLPPTTLGNAPQHGGTVIAVAITATLEDVPAMTAVEAAEELGVSTARVAQLCKAGLLDSWKVGSTRMVSADSVAYRKVCPPPPGRPKAAPEPERGGPLLAQA